MAGQERRRSKTLMGKNNGKVIYEVLGQENRETGNL
jgi:hypothetical protein